MRGAHRDSEHDAAGAAGAQSLHCRTSRCTGRDAIVDNDDRPPPHIERRRTVTKLANVRLDLCPLGRDRAAAWQAQDERCRLTIRDLDIIDTARTIGACVNRYRLALLRAQELDNLLPFLIATSIADSVPANLYGRWDRVRHNASPPTRTTTKPGEQISTDPGAP
jgi:hypothetical protein